MHESKRSSTCLIHLLYLLIHLLHLLIHRRGAHQLEDAKHAGAAAKAEVRREMTSRMQEQLEAEQARWRGRVTALQEEVDRLAGAQQVGAPAGVVCVRATPRIVNPTWRRGRATSVARRGAVRPRRPPARKSWVTFFNPPLSGGGFRSTVWGG